jgi:hypothetical protein
MTDTSPRAALSDAIRYWEPRRIMYNLALLAVVAAEFVAHLPASRTDVTFETLEWLFVSAVLANIAYGAAHVVDVLAQLSAFRPTWLRFRWVLLVIGIAFGGVLANFISQGIFAHAT